MHQRHVKTSSTTTWTLAPPLHCLSITFSDLCHADLLLTVHISRERSCRGAWKEQLGFADSWRPKHFHHKDQHLWHSAGIPHHFPWAGTADLTTPATVTNTGDVLPNEASGKRFFNELAHSCNKYTSGCWWGQHSTVKGCFSEDKKDLREYILSRIFPSIVICNLNL